MTRRLVYLLALVVFSFGATSDVWAQTDKAEARSARKDASRQRRVGHLKHNPNEDRDGIPYLLRDVWDHRTYLVAPGRGLDLNSYVDRYVALHGTVSESSSEDAHQLRVEKIVDLDLKKKRGHVPVANAVQQASFLQPTDGPTPATPMPSEVLEPGFATDVIDPMVIGSDPLVEVIEMPPGTSPVIQPMVDDLTGNPCGSCGLPHWGLGLRELFSHGGQCCGPQENFYVRAEYLMWWTDGLRLPPLITTSPNGTPRAQAGVLGETGTRVLNPGSVNNDSHSGLRIRVGGWLGGIGVGGDYYGLDDQVARQTATSTGDPILARPFFDILNGQETAELVAFPGVVTGTVSMDARTEFDSFGLHLRFNLCCGDWSVNACGHDGYRLDGFIGYRYARLHDQLVMREDLTSADPQNPGSFRIRDQFVTENKFHGGELGIQYQRQRGRLMLEFLSKLALGNNHQKVGIDGSTSISTGAVNVDFPSGILAQRTNMGSYTRDEFAVLPEIGATVGYQVTPRLKLTLGYTLVYFSNVVRAGDQVDLDVNPNLFPPEAVPFAGPLRPQFAYQETDFWAQGLSVGGDFRW